MFKGLRGRLALIGGITVFCAWLIFDRGITYGLDLQGGTYLLLEVQDPNNALDAAAREDATNRALTVVRTRTDEMGVAEPTIQKSGTDRIVVELPGATPEEQQRAKDVIQRSAFLQFQIVRPISDIAASLARIDRAVVASGIQIDSSPSADSADSAAPDLGLFTTPDSAAADSTAAADSVDADGALAAAESDTTATPLSAQPFTSRLQNGSSRGDGVFLVAAADVPVVDQFLALPAVQSALPRNVVLRWGPAEDASVQGYRFLYLLDREPLITGTYLQDAQAQRDPQMGRPLVTFEFDRRGGRIFERGTGANVNNLMAIVLDDEVVSAPVINSQIGMRGQIEMGGNSMEEASDLALVLRAGALPAPIEIIEEQAIGPTLGSDSVAAGLRAGIVGLIAVIIMVVGYYRFSGLLAVVGLSVYVLILLGAMASLGAALTFPGIAGLVLSIGMALDANVLIFERIREELDAGQSVRKAIDEGFHNAMSAIIDGHVTTIISSVILFYVGTGPVRGFAVTLGIGVAASLFSAVFVVRTLYMLYLERGGSQAQTLSI